MEGTSGSFTARSAVCHAGNIEFFADGYGAGCCKRDRNMADRSDGGLWIPF